MEAGRDTERGEGEGMGMRKGSGKSSSEVATLGFQVAWLREEESGERQRKGEVEDPTALRATVSTGTAQAAVVPLCTALGFSPEPT